MIFVFDMDGTLTPARQSMEPGFAGRFVPWLQSHTAYVATGSNLEKVREQLPEKVMMEFCGIYCAMGNDLWQRGTFTYRNDFEPEAELIDDLEQARSGSAYPYARYPNHIEKRTGSLNFSVLGRDCPFAERERYSEWDSEHGERERIARELASRHPRYDFLLGGKISIDVVLKGHGKDQVAADLRKRHPGDHITFFGDKTMPGGNDHALAAALLALGNSSIEQVDGPGEVLERLSIA